jgi:hypothetical protein
MLEIVPDILNHEWSLASLSQDDIVAEPVNCVGCEGTTEVR